MRRRRIKRSHVMLAGGAVLVGALGFTLVDRSLAAREQPAPPAALARVAEKNDDAATVAAARMKADSEQSAEAVDRLADARDRREERADAIAAGSAAAE